MNEKSQLESIKKNPIYHEEGWDSYDALPIDARAIESAERFLAYEWDVLPTTEGGIIIERHHSGCEIEINFAPDGSISTMCMSLFGKRNKK